jgi:hypothetical protein
MSDYEDFLKKRRKLWADNNRAAMAPVVAKPAAPVVAKPAARALPVVIPGGAMSPGALRKPSESVLPPSLPTAVKTPAAVAAQLNKYVKPVGPGIAAYKKKLQFEELKRSSQASEKSAPLPTFIPGKKLTASRAASLGATPAEITTALAAEQSGWKKLLDKTEESALARFGVGAARMALPGDTDAYFDNVGMTPERREMLDSSGAYGAGQFAGIAAGFMPYGAGGAAGAAKLISAVPKLAKAGRLAKGVVRAGAESVAALPQNLDIAINKDHATSPAYGERGVDGRGESADGGQNRFTPKNGRGKRRARKYRSFDKDGESLRNAQARGCCVGSRG